MRAQPKWREEIIDQADYASQLLAPLLGVRIAIDKIQDWNRVTEPSAALTALAELDKGEGVTWVIGYITPGDTATKVMSELGMAEPLGPEFVENPQAIAARSHIIALAFVRAKSMGELANALPDGDPRIPVLRRLAALQAEKGYQVMGAVGYAGSHYYASWAVTYLITIGDRAAN